MFEWIGGMGQGRRYAVLAGTVMFLGALFLCFVYRPSIRGIADLEMELAGLSERSTQSRIRVRNLARLQEERKAAEAQLEQALSILPDSREIPTLLRNITAKGEESCLEFLLFSPQKEVEKDFFVEIPVSIEVRGRYRNVVAFLTTISSMERIVHVLNVSMRPEKPLSSMLITRCTLVTYRFKGEVGE
ncbi:type 4a pilus biogenesis protein PilO [Desulfatiglans anilini]|uniref:type 4a pilus biogenesis protein PilO n=1 Tax=Desulfatiglans anilini TaxID=90728 RepID=UPI00047F3E89|nr:type 4a pilus biogenesis protein PilO [Desulfatiglans anilini]